MVGHSEGMETERAPSPFPSPPALHSCPSLLFPFSPAPGLLPFSHPREEQDTARLTRNVGWVTTTVQVNHRLKGRALISSCGCIRPRLLVGISVGRKGISTYVQPKINDEGSTITRLTTCLLDGHTGRLSFLFHQFFFGTKQKINNTLQIYNFPNLEVQLLSLL